jgi:gamma-glutamyltranspeptidase / glutathione hydrolase
MKALWVSETICHSLRASSTCYTSTDINPAAQSMVDLVQQSNGTMTLDDLKSYRVEARDAISVDVRGHRLFSTGAPSSGAICLSILKTMEQYALKDSKHVNLTTHRFAEAMRFAYAARTHIGDPDFVGNMALYENMILSNRKAKEIHDQILDNKTQPVDAYGSASTYSVEDHGTSHIVTTDDSGMAVSSTTTINLIFGAQIMTPDTGIIM